MGPELAEPAIDCPESHPSHAILDWASCGCGESTCPACTGGITFCKVCRAYPDEMGDVCPGIVPKRFFDPGHPWGCGAWVSTTSQSPPKLTLVFAAWDSRPGWTPAIMTRNDYWFSMRFDGSPEFTLSSAKLLEDAPDRWCPIVTPGIRRGMADVGAQPKPEIPDNIRELIINCATRKVLLAALPASYAAAKKAKKAKKVGQRSLMDDLFDGPVDGGDSEIDGAFPESVTVTRDDVNKMIEDEYKCLGYSPSFDPLHVYREALDSRRTHRASQFADMAAGTPLILGGLVGEFSIKPIKSGRMALFTIRDHTGGASCLIWPDALPNLEPLLRNGACVCVRGVVNKRRDPGSVVVDGVLPIERIAGDGLPEGEFTVRFGKATQEGG